jgi:ketosteroid isomerase-like protein
MSGHDGVEGETYRGHDEIRRFWEGLDEVFESVEIHNEEFRDLGDRVLAIGWWRLRGKESGVEVNSKAGWIVETRGDKIAYLHSYGDPREALDAAGCKSYGPNPMTSPVVPGIVGERPAPRPWGQRRMRWHRLR